MKLKLLLTGNELMTGDTIDSNSAMIAQMCLDQGVQVHYKACVSDDLSQLVNEIRRLTIETDVLIINGGLGPTQDDLTAQALAQVMGVELEEHPEALAHVKAWCTARHYELSEANRKQAFLPKGISLVANPEGTAVGFKANINGCLTICTPGVPHELRAMLKQQILTELSAMLPANIKPERSRLRVFGFGESSLQQHISDTYPDWPEQVELGFRASLPLMEVKLKVDYAEHHSLLQQWRANMRTLLGDHLVTEDHRSMAEVVIDLLQAQGKKITCAESCTGGLIASMITGVSGASTVFEAGFVTYANEIKSRVLGVSESDLAAHGAVSETVVRQMLSGALEASGADIGVAVSGIAGPDGGSAEKPVGTVWIAWGDQNAMHTRAFYFPGKRIFFQKMIAALALDLLRRELLQSKETPDYFERIKR